MNIKFTNEIVIESDNKVKEVIKEFLYPSFRIYSSDAPSSFPLYINGSTFEIGEETTEENAIEEANDIFANELLDYSVKKHFSVFVNTEKEQCTQVFSSLFKTIQSVVNEKGNIHFFFIAGHLPLAEKETPHLHIFYEAYEDNKNEFVKAIMKALSE